jgi:LemA protein
MKKFALTLGIVALLVVFLLIGGCSSYNRLNSLKQQTDKSWADVQNVYQRRADLIPNLVKTVEGAANFEKSTLTEVVKARQQVTKIQVDPSKAPDDPEVLKQFQQTQDQLSSALSRLLVVAEQYPQLTATAGFRDLQAQLEGTENRISVERGKFNDAVGSYNTAVTSMPARLFAGMFGFQTRPYFTARAGSDVPPEVKFDIGNPPKSPAPVEKP